MSMDEPVIGQSQGEPELAGSAQDVSDDAGATALPEAFRPGNALQVAYVGSHRRPAFNSAVVQVEDGAVALELTRLPRDQAPPREGDPVVLVTRRGMAFEAFDAQVIDVRPTRAGLLVTPPVEARRPERRLATRVPVSIPLRSGVWLDSGGAEYTIDAASLVDISAGGAQIRSLQFVAPGCITRLAFALHPGERPVLVQAMVAAVTGEVRTVAQRLHLQFIEMPDDSREQLARFVTHATARLPKAA